MLLDAETAPNSASSRKAAEVTPARPIETSRELLLQATLDIPRSRLRKLTRSGYLMAWDTAASKL